MAEREFSPEERQADAAEGHALADGSYPIEDCDSLRRAIQSYGRAPEAHRAALRRLIAKRKAELGCPGVELPETWRLVHAGG